MPGHAHPRGITTNRLTAGEHDVVVLMPCEPSEGTRRSGYYPHSFGVMIVEVEEVRGTTYTTVTYRMAMTRHRNPEEVKLNSDLQYTYGMSRGWTLDKRFWSEWITAPRHIAHEIMGVSEAQLEDILRNM